MLFRRRYELAEENCSPGWEASEWRSWEPPFNLVKGESFHQENLTALAGPPRRHGYLIPVRATLVRDPKNRNDPNAIRVEIDGKLVGHLDRAFAAAASPLLDKARCRSFDVAAIIRGGARRTPSFGVHLWTGRRLCPGPNIAGLDDVEEFEISWPPYVKEGEEE